MFHHTIIRYVDPLNGTDDALVAWWAYTECRHYDIDGNPFDRVMYEMHIATLPKHCGAPRVGLEAVPRPCVTFDDGNYEWNPFVNYMDLYPANGYYDECDQCQGRLLEVESDHMLVNPRDGTVGIPVAASNCTFDGYSSHCMSADFAIIGDH